MNCLSETVLVKSLLNFLDHEVQISARSNFQCVCVLFYGGYELGFSFFIAAPRHTHRVRNNNNYHIFYHPWSSGSLLEQNTQN